MTMILYMKVAQTAAVGVEDVASGPMHSLKTPMLALSKVFARFTETSLLLKKKSISVGFMSCVCFGCVLNYYYLI